MKILVFGKTGQVATELRRHAVVEALGRDDADLTNPEQCAGIIEACDVDAVINAAAYTAVDRAEKEEGLATLINGAAPAAMARAAARKGVPFLHVSTDYVFDGSGTAAWSVEDKPAPVNAYGRSKLEGERGVAEAGGAFAILRTSWVFSAHGTNFLKTMLRLGRERGKLQIVDDQIGGPTPARDIADSLIVMAHAFHAKRAASGLYHLSGAPDVSWLDFAREIFAQADIRVDLTGISTSDYPTPAVRPLNSRLGCARMLAGFNIERPDWRQGLTRELQDLGVV